MQIFAGENMSDDIHHKKWAIVTGSSSGMGLSVAHRLIDDGWHVLGLDVDEPALQSSDRFQTVSVDIRNRAAISQCLQDKLLPNDAVSLVANIAGVYPPSTLDSFTEDLYRKIFDINVLGTLNVIAESKSYLAPEAVIVNFASVDAFTVSEGQLLYGASKAAIVMLTKELALELAPAGLRVNAIAPGWVNTPGNSKTGRMDAASQSIPVGRVAQPTEIADWVLLLANNSGFMTGETIVLSGGDVIR